MWLPIASDVAVRVAFGGELRTVALTLDKIASINRTSRAQGEFLAGASKDIVESVTQFYGVLASCQEESLRKVYVIDSNYPEDYFHERADGITVQHVLRALGIRADLKLALDRDHLRNAILRATKAACDVLIFTRSQGRISGPTTKGQPSVAPPLHGTGRSSSN